MAVIETVEHLTRTICGKTYEVTITRREGVDSYIDLTIDPSGTPFLADAATFIDYGPKMGVTKCGGRLVDAMEDFQVIFHAAATLAAA